MSAYLFVHFTSENEIGEQIYFSLSKDGLHWNDLNNSKPVLYSNLGTKGVRDPFVLRSKLDNKFYIIATDLRIAAGLGWEAAKYKGSRKMIIWSSDDLINWSEAKAYEFPREDFCCVWAPEAIYDNDEKAYLVFWSSFTQEPYETAPKFKIYSSYTKDFENFTEPRVYIERERDVIDTTIAEENGVFYRFSKDEVTKGIVEDYGTKLTGDFTEVKSDSLSKIMGVEGPASFYIEDKKQWCLLLDRFAAKQGYMPLLCDDLKRGEFKEVKDYDMGVSLKRHGSVIAISDDEYERLVNFKFNV